MNFTHHPEELHPKLLGQGGYLVGPTIWPSTSRIGTLGAKMPPRLPTGRTLVHGLHGALDEVAMEVNEAEVGFRHGVERPTHGVDVAEDQDEARLQNAGRDVPLGERPEPTGRSGSSVKGDSSPQARRAGQAARGRTRQASRVRPVPVP